MTQVEAALALFSKSVLKQAKFQQISSLLEDPRDRANLDLGGDNGILSFLLRQKGGTWSSGDLDEKTVGSIRSLVGDRVYRLDGAALPFPDESLDQIVVAVKAEGEEAFRRKVQYLADFGKTVGIPVVDTQVLSQVMLALLDERW